MCFSRCLAIKKPYGHRSEIQGQVSWMLLGPRIHRWPVSLASPSPVFSWSLDRFSFFHLPPGVISSFQWVTESRRRPSRLHVRRIVNWGQGRMKPIVACILPLEFRNQSQHLRVLCSFVNVVQVDSTKTQVCLLRRGPSLTAELDTMSVEYGGASVFKLGVRPGRPFLQVRGTASDMPTENSVFAQFGARSSF